MKKSYIAPEMKVFNIGAEEQIAVGCVESTYHQDIEPCTGSLVAGYGGDTCNETTPFSS